MTCQCCKNEPEPGFIEMPNNGPIVPCWVCNFELWRASADKPAVRLSPSILDEQHLKAWHLKRSLS